MPRIARFWFIFGFWFFVLLFWSMIIEMEKGSDSNQILVNWVWNNTVYSNFLFYSNCFLLCVDSFCFRKWWARWVCWIWPVLPRHAWGQWPWLEPQEKKFFHSLFWVVKSGAMASMLPRSSRAPKQQTQGSRGVTRWWFQRRIFFCFINQRRCDISI